MFLDMQVVCAIGNFNLKNLRPRMLTGPVNETIAFLLGGLVGGARRPEVLHTSLKVACKLGKDPLQYSHDS